MFWTNDAEANVYRFRSTSMILAALDNGNPKFE